MKWTESDIQALKSQEAKDLAIEFLQQLEAKQAGPISPGEVQLKELDFELRLREAEREDQRCQLEHQQRIKELELQIEQERTRAAEAESRANEVRQAHALIIERVAESSESLSTQLERSTREHNLKLEKLKTAYDAKKEELVEQINELEQRRDQLEEEIGTLTDLHSDAKEISRLREEVDERKGQLEHEHASTEEQAAAAEYEKTKRIRAVQQSQELELAKLDNQHQKDILQLNQQTAESILEGLNRLAVDRDEWQQLQEELQQKRQRSDEESAELRENARAELRREYNITRHEPVDVTELFYQVQAATAETGQLRSQLDKQEIEINRMRQHIEQEPQRIAAAVEAAKTPVQNYIEQGGKR